MRGCVRGPTEPEARCQGINSGGEKQRRRKQYPTAVRSGCENEAGSPRKPGLFSEGLKQSPLQLGRRKISNVCRGARAAIAQAEGEKCACGTHHFTAHGACLLCMFHEALSALSPEALFVQAPDSSASSNAISSGLPPASSQPHHLNPFKRLLPKQTFTHFISLFSSQAVTPQRPSSSTYSSENDSSVFPKGMT